MLLLLLKLLLLLLLLLLLRSQPLGRQVQQIFQRRVLSRLLSLLLLLLLLLRSSRSCGSLLLGLTALTVVLLVSVVGIILVIALLTLPAAMANLFARRLWQMMLLAALACALGQEDFSVALIEGRQPQRDWPADEIDLRVSALTRASQNLLANLGAWPAMTQRRISPYRCMQVWDAGSSGAIHFDCSDIGEDNLGHIVENRVTQLALWQQLQGMERYTLRNRGVA